MPTGKDIVNTVSFPFFEKNYLLFIPIMLYCWRKKSMRLHIGV